MSVDFSFRGAANDQSLNFNNVNAKAVLQALRLPLADASGSLCGQCSLPEMRRAIMRARSSDLSALERKTHVEYGAPRASGNVIEARPVRYWAPGLSVGGIELRIDALEMLVRQAAEAGATEIYWA